MPCDWQVLIAAYLPVTLYAVLHAKGCGSPGRRVRER